jgi:hypothetical protein
MACNFGTKALIEKGTVLFDTSKQQPGNMRETGDKDRTIRLSLWAICSTRAPLEGVHAAAAVVAAAAYRALIQAR